MTYLSRWLPTFLLLLLCVAWLQPAEAKPRQRNHAVAAKAKHHSKARQHAKAKPKRQLAVARPARPAQPEVLALRSTAAFVVDPETDQVLYGKNASAVQPIASLTKLMTGLVIEQAALPMEEQITIADEDVDRVKYSSSRLPVGTTLTRREALHLALMSSENRAAHALGRTYPGGMAAFVAAMNNKARQLGMESTRYVEPTGLSSSNQSSARDLAVLVEAAADRPLLREYSTSTGYELDAGKRTLHYGNTNRLVHDPLWKISIQKTGYISEAGQCLLLQTRMAGRKLIMVFLDSAGKLGRIRDAQAMRRWLQARPELLNASR